MLTKVIIILIKVTQVFAVLNYLNSVNPELKDTESAITNKLIDLLTESKGFKFMTSLVLDLKKKVLIKRNIYLLFQFKNRNNY